MVVERGVSVVREKEKNRTSKPFIWEKFNGARARGKDKKFSNEKNVSPKEIHASPRKKGMNNPSRFIISPTVSSVRTRMTCGAA